MNTTELKQKLITNAVNNLIEFGYPDVNKENIFTDEVYKVFFASMLNDNKGFNIHVDEAIETLLGEIK